MCVVKLPAALAEPDQMRSLVLNHARPDSLMDDVRLLGLERQGLIRRPRKVGSVWEDLKSCPAPRLKAGRSAVAALLAEREDGR